MDSKARTHIKKLRNLTYPFTINILDIPIIVDKNVYKPGRTAIMLLEYISKLDLQGKSILDYGAGTGIIGIYAAKRGASVTAIDRNPDAINCAQKNARNNNISMSIIKSDGFEHIPVDRKFDYIFASTSYEEGDANDEFEYSFFDPQLLFRKSLFENAKRCLKKDGNIYFTYSNTAQKKEPIENTTAEFTCKKVHEKEIDGEISYLLEITRNN